MIVLFVTIDSIARIDQATYSRGLYVTDESGQMI
jgi:hypothetical protein